MEELIKELKARKFPQRQDSTLNQLEELRKIANAIGLYDAADYLNAYLQGR